MLWKSGLLLATCFVLVASGQEQAKRQLTARELFYSAVQTPAKTDAAPPPVQAKSAPAPKATPTQVASAEKKAAPAVKSQPSQPSQPSPSQPSQPVQSATLRDGTRIVPAAATVGSAASSGMPLGLKYSVLKKSGDNMVEVAATSIFHAGDRIQINVQTNQAGYLYIVTRGSSGIWKPMFPSAEVEDGNNHVEGFKTYVMPPKSRLLFDEQAGDEKLFLIFSRVPEPDLEKMIYSLQGGAAIPASKKDQPVQKAPLLMASAKIDDMTVGRLRNTYSRDLVIETVDENTPGARKEEAIYVVNPTGSADSRVVADIKLVHQ
ncbi:MAG TPA: DUF4384 domain-containing protein [Bryobacteraceae bacterium]|nr:DUF4384 domain-containing protein [Bryobacteraceae bacterium]